MRTITLTLISVLAASAFAQKNAMTLEDCEQALQKNNLMLLARQYDIASAQAEIIQAKIWEHPYISADWNAYNPETDTFFDVGKQKTIAIDQLIYLGGKKKNEVRLARKKAEIAALEFEELLFNLRFELRKSFYAIYFDAKKLALLDNQISQIEQLVSAYESQAEKGNVALKEVVRLQSLLLDIRHERIEIFKNASEERRNLALLTGIDTPVEPLAESKNLIGKFAKLLEKPDDLLLIGKEKNPEYKIALLEIEARQVDIKFQKSLAIPDVTVGAGYDQFSGAFRNETNMRVGIPLPLWNKNKGNIKVSEAELAKSKTDGERKLFELKADLESAYAIWDENRKQILAIKESVYDNLESVNKGILSNFQKRNISLNEFTDFMESYNLSVLNLNESYKQLILSGETLNHLVNDTLFQP
ncbi:TolC family protein [Flavobacterium sp.]|uniref:TolC family protein n=1 Tax=Flavobacterium sp. TaxID=239 RepID=UPI0025B98D06|nr:TolC family protein [Flavobacterium sp.]